jgi:hypothetical protein
MAGTTQDTMWNHVHFVWIDSRSNQLVAATFQMHYQAIEAVEDPWPTPELEPRRRSEKSITVVDSQEDGRQPLHTTEIQLIHEGQGQPLEVNHIRGEPFDIHDQTQHIDTMLNSLEHEKRLPRPPAAQRLGDIIKNRGYLVPVFHDPFFRSGRPRCQQDGMSAFYQGLTKMMVIGLRKKRRINHDDLHGRHPI